MRKAESAVTCTSLIPLPDHALYASLATSPPNASRYWGIELPVPAAANGPHYSLMEEMANRPVFSSAWIPWTEDPYSCSPWDAESGTEHTPCSLMRL